MRKLGIALLLTGLSAGIAYLFWHDDWKYGLPTPVPMDHKVVETGTAIDLSDHLAMDEDRPVFLHFFNPKCPCSRFNIPEFRSLARTYGDRIRFGVVVLSPEEYSEEEIQNKIGLELPISFDRSLANACGVYSTPQAVLIDADSKLYYRGNYNKSRYCTDKATSYAQFAIDSLLNGHADVNPGLAAVTSYGCQLPNCTK
jgi:hypothetical protein